MAALRRRLPRRPPLAPVLVALWGPLAIWASLPGTLPPVALVRLLVLLPLAGLVLSAVIARFCPVRQRAAAIACLLLVAVVAMSQPLWIVAARLGVAALAIEWAASLLLRRPLIPWARLGGLIDFAALTLLLTPVVGLVGTFGPAGLVARLVPERPVEAVTLAPGTARPDIWFILLDGHGRPDLMAERYGLDESAFTGALEDDGFSVATDSRSDHLVTELTLAAMLNERPLAELFAGGALTLPDGSPDWVAALGGSRPLAQLRGAGYEIIASDPGFDHVTLWSADRLVGGGGPDLAESGILMRGLMLDPTGTLARSVPLDWARDRLHATFAAARALAAEPAARPRFTWLHVSGPHLPLVVDATGAPVDSAPDVGRTMMRPAWADADPARWASLVAGQTAWIDGQVRALVDDIVAADPDAVIVVFSDHGPDQPIEAGQGRPLPADQADERSRNLLAVRSPGHPIAVEGLSTTALLGAVLDATLGIPSPTTVPATLDCPVSAPLRCVPAALPGTPAGAP